MSVNTEIELLRDSVDRLHTDVVELRREVSALTAIRHTGKGMLYGLLIAAGGVGAGTATAVNKILG